MVTPIRDLQKIALILLVIVLAGIIVHFGESFLLPLTFAALLSTLLLPAFKWLMAKGVNKVFAILLSILLIVAFFVGLFALLGWQISNLAEDAPQIEKQITQRYQDLREYIKDTFGISEEKQREVIEKQKDSTGAVSGMATSLLSGLGSFLTDIILTLVYIFLFLFYKDHLKRFFIGIAPADKKDAARSIVEKSARVTQKYLTGLALMIMTLWVMYSIGFSIAGVKSPVFFAVLCGFLEIIPFIGNILGTTLTVLFTVMQGGGTNVIIGILITYGLIQFVQTYMLEPLVVGAEVNINPLFTIISLVLGELVWGLPGMVLAIPLMGVTKIICDNVGPLKLFGELIGGSKKEGSAFKMKIKALIDKMVNLFRSGRK